jgi:hypothetical protein
MYRCCAVNVRCCAVNVQVLCCECTGVSWLNMKFQVMTVRNSLFPCHVTSYGRTVQSLN